MGKFQPYDPAAHPHVWQATQFHDPFGCPCCAPALGELLRQSGIDMELQAGRFAARSWPPRPVALPLAIRNARILTMHAAMPEAEAMLVRDGRITWIGAERDVDAHAEGDEQRIDCRGKTVLPGFIEPHMHLASIALLARFENVGPFRYPSFEGALARLHEVATGAGPDDWILGRQFDPSLQDGPLELTADLLDQVSTTQPVYVFNASLHFAYCNSRALELAGISAETPDPAGSEFGRYPDGSPNGVLKGGGAMAAVSSHNPAMHGLDLVTGCLDVFKHANEKGLTTVVDQGTGALQGRKELEIYRALRESNAMTARFRYSLFNTLAEHWDQTELRCGDGDEWVRATGWKIVTDGSNQGRTGLQREEFLNTGGLGIAYIEPDALNADVERRLGEGWQLVIHANGDAAIDRALDAFELAAEQGHDIASRRCRIEHCSILHDEQIERIAALGISPSFLIGHVHYWGKAFRDDIFGPDKAALLDRTAACEARGIRWTLHSDEPVTEMDPLRCIENAVTRRMWKAPDEILAEQECISVDAALRAMTIDAAWQCHSDHEIGSLEAGKFADFVVLDADPRTVPPTQIGSIAVHETWVGGQRVH